MKHLIPTVLGFLFLLTACAEEGPGTFFASNDQFGPEFDKLIEYKLGLDERREADCRRQVEDPKIDVEEYTKNFYEELNRENWQSAREIYDNLFQEVRLYNQIVHHAGCIFELPGAKYPVPDAPGP